MIEHKITYEKFKTGSDPHPAGSLPFARVTVIADSAAEAVAGLEDILANRIHIGDLPKTGLDLRKKGHKDERPRQTHPEVSG